MSTPLQPLADFVVAQAEVAEKKTASGFLLPEKATEKPQTAKVVAIGVDVKHIKVGDLIVYKGYSNTDVTVGSETYTLVKEEDILALVKSGK